MRLSNEAFAKLVPRAIWWFRWGAVATLALVTVVLLLAIYALVIVACLKLRGKDEDERTFRAAGLAGVIIGRALYEGQVVLKDVIDDRHRGLQSDSSRNSARYPA